MNLVVLIFGAFVIALLISMAFDIFMVVGAGLIWLWRRYRGRGKETARRVGW